MSVVNPEVYRREEDRRESVELHWKLAQEAKARGEVAWPFDPAADAHFVSGSNGPNDIRGVIAAGWNVGVAVHELSSAAIKTLADEVSGLRTRVFVDSGAFSEVDDDFKVVEPITDKEWTRRLGIYKQLARALKRQMYAVAPDLVGSQTGTLERLERYRDDILEVRNLGAHLIVPIQPGPIPPGEFDARVQQIIGDDIYVRGLPLQKAPKGLNLSKRAAFEGKLARTAALVEHLVATGQLYPRFHLLGRGPNSDEYAPILRIIREHLPFAQATSDSMYLRSSRLMSSRVKGDGHKGYLTERQDELRAQGLLPGEVKRLGTAKTLDHEGLLQREEAWKAGWFDPELIPDEVEAQAKALANKLVASGFPGPTLLALRGRNRDIPAGQLKAIKAYRANAVQVYSNLLMQKMKPPKDDVFVGLDHPPVTPFYLTSAQYRWVEAGVTIEVTNAGKGLAKMRMASNGMSGQLVGFVHDGHQGFEAELCGIFGRAGGTLRSAWAKLVQGYGARSLVAGEDKRFCRRAG